MIVDLRSDTVTKPSKQMLQAMMIATVGDDVYGEDPTVKQLEETLAKKFNMQAGLFCPSGTMANQIAIKIHTQPADELICADNAHIYKYEGGGIAANSGVQARLLAGQYGKITHEQIQSVINANDIHFPKTTLVCLENTSNRGGGSYYTREELTQIKTICFNNNLTLHLDGARVFNALQEADYDAAFLGETFNTISVCLSKSLGAPVGSVLLGSIANIQHALRLRKMLGGGMRQAGYMAAAGIYALQHNVSKLAIDHQHAQKIAQVLAEQAFVKSMLPVKTNIIIFKLIDAKVADSLQAYFKSKNIIANKVSADELRFVFHLDVTESMIDELLKTITSYSY